jgi:long-chain acyl-CoA synthetase
MHLDLDLYRREVRVSTDPLVRLSAIDVAPDRPRHTMVFIHGFGGEAEQWQYQLQHFLIEDRVIALDLRGHGLSDHPRQGYDMLQIRADLERALEVLGVRAKFTLIGHSFGGAIVTDYARAHPDRVERLVLIATAGEFKLARFFALGLHMPDWLLRIAGVFLGKRLAAPPHPLKAMYRDNLSKWVGWEDFKSLHVPTLVIRGDRDDLFEKAYFENVARSIPDAQEADIPGSGHLVMLERREAVNRALERFVGGKEQQSWRGSLPATQRPERKRPGSRDALRQERPWLLYYDAACPIPLPCRTSHYTTCFGPQYGGFPKIPRCSSRAAVCPIGS